MEQFEQLLTCAICLDRYRNPKLLPCQHSFCMEPCMDGLVDYVRRQVKCPECRAEHRIPYNGVQGYPTNVTLQRFLELHIEITGELPDPTSGQVMKRCGVCSEKAYVMPCVHCDKEVCTDCKGAHMDILRREISRINNQVRRAVHRLSDMLAGVEKNMLTLQLNCTSVSEEVDEIYRRLSKALTDRTEHLRGEIDRYLTTELKNLCNLKENLDIEISNIQSNCDLADKYMQSDDVEWDDSELMDAKEIFLKTVEFIRNFETDIGDYNRKAKFIMAHDPNQLVMHVAGYGDLSIQAAHQPFSASSNMLQAPGPGLMRSKSDHRLASQFRQEERNAYEPGGEIGGRVSPLGGRKFGERYPARYARGDRSDYDVDSSHDNENRSTARSRIRSRLNRHGKGDNTDSDTDSRSVRFSETNTVHRERERVLDTEDVAKGPLSGITRLYDSPRVMKRLQENENKEKKVDVAPKPQVQQQMQQQVQQLKKTSPQQTPQRQLSEDDEIARIKRQNKNASTSSDTERRDRVSVIKRDDSRDSNRSPSDASRKTPVPEPAENVEDSGSESEEEVVEPRKTTPINKPGFPPTSSSAAGSRRSSATSGNIQKIKSARSESIESSGSYETPGTPGTPGTPVRRNAGVTFPTDEVKQSPAGSRSGSATPRARFSSVTSKRDSATPTNSRSQSYSLTGNKDSPVKKEEIEDEEEEEEDTDTSSESSESESDEDSEEAKPKTPAPKAVDKTDIGPLLARSANARDNGSGGSNSSSRRPSQDETYTRSRYGTGGYKSSSSYQSPKEPEPASSGSKYLNRTAPRFTSRFLKNKSIEEDPSKSSYGSESKYNDKGLLRSRTSANVDEDLQDDPVTSPYSSSYSKNHYGSDLSRSRSSHALKSRETSPDRPLTNSSGAGDKDGGSLSSWARYLKNKYGNRSKDNAAKDNGPSSSAGAASASAPSASRRLSMGLGSRSNSTVVDSSDDDQKNMQSSPTSRTIIEPGIQGVGSTPRVQYLQKRQLLYKIGGRGSEPGYFTWPRGVAVGPDNLIVVADSSNHRVQVFDSRGSLFKDFGSYGNGEGEFDCLAGVAVNRIGQFIIADRYNHRIQVLDPSGRFLRSFGSQGSSDGRFNYPWGITTDALGFIYVCDKENHRIQVFQSDGTFVGKFGSQGNKIGQLEHPHYIAVSNTNRVIVSDCNNHRVQIFDVNGRVISSFGSEGSENGQFKFPKGVAVDDQGYILVADSGNNRIQIFHPDSTFLRAFGCWGSGDGEFKGLEGIAVMSNGNILVCDRENHRVQVF